MTGLERAADDAKRTAVPEINSYSAFEIDRARLAGAAEMELTTAADMFSYGVIAYELLTLGIFDFRRESIERLFRAKTVPRCYWRDAKSGL